MLLKLIYVVCSSISFLFAEMYFTVWISHDLFIPSHVVGPLVVSSVWLFWIMLLWLFDYPCTNFRVNMFLLLLGMNLSMELLGQMVTLCLTFWETMEWFSEVSILTVITSTQEFKVHLSALRWAPGAGSFVLCSADLAGDWGDSIALCHCLRNYWRFLHSLLLSLSSQ